MLHMGNFIAAQTFEDMFQLEEYLKQGGLVVVEIGNKNFSTRILDGGRRLRVTRNNAWAASVKDCEQRDIDFSGPRILTRIKTQVTNLFGSVLKFEGYYLQYSVTSTELRDAIVPHLSAV